MRTLYLLILVCILSSCKQAVRKLPYYNTADFTPKWDLQPGSSFHTIRTFNLIDQQGNRFTEKNIDGKICVADFFFTTCPGICPKMANSMADIQKAFLNDTSVLLLSHSVTPERDSVPVLQAYAQKKGVDFKRWRLLTGSRQEIYDLGRRYYFIEEDLGLKRDSSVFLHTENFVLIDEQRHIRGIYNGLDPNSIASLIKDIGVLKQVQR